jgi:hypothetical protein
MSTPMTATAAGFFVAGFLPFRILAIGSNGTGKRATGTVAF